MGCVLFGSGWKIERLVVFFDLYPADQCVLRQLLIHGFDLDWRSRKILIKMK